MPLTTLKEGEKAPVFILKDQNEQSHSLSDYQGKWVILYFYPKDNTPGCTIEAIEFTAHLKKFEKLNTVVFGVSPDSPQSHCNFIEKQALRVTLLSDPNHEMLEKYGAWQKKQLYGKEFMGVVRSTYLINPQGKIAAIWPKVQAQGHAEEVLERIGKM